MRKPSDFDWHAYLLRKNIKQKMKKKKFEAVPFFICMIITLASVAAYLSMIK